jgi:hypothetical protein
MYRVMDSVIEFERQLDCIIEADPRFGEWYFSDDRHFRMLPDEAYVSYGKTRAAIIMETFRLRMVMRKNNWDDTYLVTELDRITCAINDEFETRAIGAVYTNHFTPDDFVSQFKGVTDYTEARCVVQAYLHLYSQLKSASAV